MRCNKCNVDLSELYTTCPLCGNEAVNEEPKIKGLGPAPYSKNTQIPCCEKEKQTKTPFSIEKIKAYFNL